MAAKTTTTPKPVAKAKAQPVAKAKPAVAKPPPATAAGFDGTRLVDLLGVQATDERLVQIVRELGYTKPLGDNVELKKLGIALVLDDGRLQQIQFEIRRRWTGHAKYEGVLPYGISSDHATRDAATTLPGHTQDEPLGNTGWGQWQMPGHTVSIGFGKKLIETVFVIAKP